MERNGCCDDRKRHGGGPDRFCPAVDELGSKQLGDLGESIAACYLMERGYDVLERNYRCHEGEADLIAYDPRADAIVLVEVKTRRVRSFDGEVYPEEAVDRRKRRRYRRIASCYVMEHYPVRSIRFDVIAITIYSERSAGVEHIHGAFDWDAGE